MSNQTFQWLWNVVCNPPLDLRRRVFPSKDGDWVPHGEWETKEEALELAVKEAKELGYPSGTTVEVQAVNRLFCPEFDYDSIPEKRESSSAEYKSGVDPSPDHYFATATL